MSNTKKPAAEKCPYGCDEFVAKEDLCPSCRVDRGLAEDACPSCGCEPGDGKTHGCTDPIGCGYTP